MELECDCGLIFTDEQLIKCDDGSIYWVCSNCGDCREYF